MKLIIFLILILNALADTSYFENAQIGDVTALDSKLILQLNSTTKASLFAPRMTTIQRNAIAQPIIGGSVVFDTDLNNYFAWDTLNLTWKAIGGGAASLSNWTTATAYKIGSSVVVPGENNDVFRALTDHTSGVFNTDRLAGAWEKISPTTIKIFTPATQYFTGDLIKTIDDQIFVARINFIANADPVVDMATNNMEFRSPNDFTTSPLRGGVITYAAPNYNVAAGTGVIVTNAGTPFAQIAPVAWNAATVTMPNTTGYNTIQVNSAGVVSAVSGINTALASKQNIVLAIIFAPTNDIIPRGTAAVDHGNDMRTLSLMLGIIKSGIIFNGNAGARTFISTSGNIFLDGIGKGTETPNIKACPPQAVTSFRLYDRNTDFGVTTTLPNNQYDVAGNQTAVPGTNWTYHKIFLGINCQIFLQYGQDVAPSKNEITALEEANRDSYVVNPQLEGIVKFIGVVYFQNNNADFSSIATTFWRNSGLFGIGSAGSGSSITATGDILGPAAAVDSHPLLFDGPTGKLAKDASGATFDPLGLLTLDGGTAALRITSGTSSADFKTTGATFTNALGSLALQPSPAQAGNMTLTFPTTLPADRQILQTDATGNLSWVTNGALTNWVTAKDYVIGETVTSPTNFNDVFRSLTNHTSSASFDADRAAGDWEIISPTHEINYAVGKQFFLNDLIRTSNGSIYNATADFVATTQATDIATGRMQFLAPADYTTSVTSGGAVTFGAPNYAIAAGTGIIVTNGGTPFSNFANVVWNAINIPEPLPDPNGYNTIAVSNIGIVSSYAGLPTPVSSKTSLILATVFAPTRTIISRNGAATDHGNTNRSLSLIMGLIKDKIEFTGNADLTFQTKSGNIYYDGVAPFTEQPNILPCAVKLTTTFLPYDQDTRFAAATNLNTTQYDLAGVLTPIPAGNWGFYKLFLAPNCDVMVQYGQEFAASEAAIISSELNGRNSYIINPALTTAVKFVGLVFFQEGVTDLTESPSVTWINSGIFGMGVAGSGSTVTTNGDVFGPTASTDNAVVRFDGGSGKIIQSSGVTIDDTNNLAGVVTAAVGAGTFPPYAPLDVKGNIFTTIHGDNNQHNAAEIGSTRIGMKSGNGADGFGGLQFNVSATRSDGAGPANSSNIAFYTWGNSIWASKEVARITERGQLGINTTNPVALFDVVGNFNVRSNSNAQVDASTAAVNFQIGRTNAGGVPAGQAASDISFGYGGGGGFRHYISTTHNGTANTGQNAINFYANTGTTSSASSAPGTGNRLAMSLSDKGVVIGGLGSNLATNKGSGQLSIVGPAGNALGPHMTFNDDGDIYPQRQFLNWGHNSVHDCFDCFHDGSWRHSTGSSSFRWLKDGTSLTLAVTANPTQNGTEAFLDSFMFQEDGVLRLRKYDATGGPNDNPVGSGTYPYLGGTIDFYTSRGRIAQLRGASSAGGQLDGASEMWNNNGGWGWQRAWIVGTNSPPSVYFNGPISASNVTNRSSAILKKNIQPITENDVELFLKLNPIKYQNRDTPYIGRKRGEPLSDLEHDEKFRYGFILEAMEEVRRDWVENKGAQTIMEYNAEGVATPTDVPVAAYSIPSMVAMTVHTVHELYDRVGVLEAQIGTPTEPPPPIDTSTFVVGPSTSIDNNIPRFDGTTGKKVQGSGIKIDDLNNFTGINNLTMASSITAGGSLTAGGSIVVGGNITVSGGDLIVGRNISSTGYISVSNGAYKLPTVRGTAGQVLTSDGAGNSTWTTPGTPAAMSATITKQQKTIDDLIKRIKALERKK